MEKEKNIVNNDILRSNYTNHIFYSFLSTPTPVKIQNIFYQCLFPFIIIVCE